MHKFVRNLITEWRKLKLPFEGETFVVAVSGGADSVSLMLALHDLLKRKKLDLRFVIAHFNHNLRGAESDADEEFVKHLTTEFGFELVLGHGKISHEGNLEQNARASRYAFLTETANNLKAYGVLTAHTMNDQAETFLMNLIRGSGVDGLSGMRAVRDLCDAETRRQADVEINKPEKPVAADAPFLPFSSSPLLIRPLLSWAKRLDTENFCRESEAEYRYDTMNEDMAFKRVRIRKILLPLLLDFNPKIIETLANTANLLRLSEPSAVAVGLTRLPDNSRAPDARPQPPATAGGSDKIAQKSEPRAVATGFSEALTIQHLKSLPKPDLYRTLREWLGNKRGNLRSLELKHIEAIERLILSRKSGKTVELPNGETVVKQDGKLEFANIRVDK